MVTVVVKHAMERGVRRMKKLSRIELNCTYAKGTGTWFRVRVRVRARVRVRVGRRAGRPHRAA